jgi:hypothetical protein
MGVGHGKVVEKSELGPTPLILILILNKMLLNN